MGLWPFSSELLDQQITISTFSNCSVGGIPLKAGGTADVVGSTTAVFTPFRISRPITVTNMWISIGSANGNNVDLGIYNTDGTKIVSTGNTAEGTVSVIQTIAVTSTYLGAGTYYFAHSESGATGSIKGQTLSAAGLLQCIGMAQTASANTLPATATLATITSTQVPIMGLTARSFV